MRTTILTVSADNGIPAAVGPFTEDQLVGALVVTILVVFGAVMLYFGWKNLRQGLSIWSNDPIDAGSVHAADDVVEVQGEVEPIDGTVSSKYTNTPAVAYTYERKRKREKRDQDGNTETEWETVESGKKAIPFYVTDETGSVAVDPDGATLSLKSTEVTSSSGRLLSFGRSVSGRTEKRYEGRLEPGDTVHVYGQKIESIEKGAPGDERIYVGSGEDVPGFSISDATEFRTVLRFVGKGVATMAVGLGVVTGVGAFLWFY